MFAAGAAITPAMSRVDRRAASDIAPPVWM